MSATDTGISATTDMGEFELRWHAFPKYQFTRYSICLYIEGGRVIIPKRAFETDKQEETFVMLLTKNGVAEIA